MKTEIQKLIQVLLYGNKKEAKQAKDRLIKEIGGSLKRDWVSREELEKRGKAIKSEMAELYKMLFSSYKNIENHNKYPVLTFLSHALFFFEESPEYFEKFLLFIRESLVDMVDGSLRQSAVLTVTNTYCMSTLDIFEPTDKKISQKQKNSYNKYKNIIENHITLIFNQLEKVIEKDENNFPSAIENMKSSVAKSHLLYLYNFDRRDVLQSFGEIFNDEPFIPKSGYEKTWYKFYENILKIHPNIKKFIKKVPRFDLHKNEEYEEEEFQNITEMVNVILNRKPQGALDSDFLFEKENTEKFLGGFLIPTDAYFEIWDVIRICNNGDELLKMYEIIYPIAKKAQISEIYWYDLLAFILSKLENHPLRKKTLEEAINKLSPKININLPLNENGINNIHYGIHEQRPIFRILIAYAIYNDDYGNKEIAKDYYKFLLKLNPWDNQGVRYLLATIYAGKSASYTDELFDEGNKNQNWDKLENFLNEQNSKYHFWQAPE